MYEVDIARGYCKSYFRTEDGRIILSRVSDDRRRNSFGDNVRVSFPSRTD